MSEGNTGSGSSSGNPRDFSALLRFCTEITAREDTTQASQLTELTPERREFLENVFNGLQGNDMRFIAECLEKLTSTAVQSSNENVTEQETALDNIAEYTEDVDFALDIYNLNGFPILKNCLRSPHTSIQQRAAQCIGTICQNDKTCQRHMLSLNVLPVLLNIVDSDTDPMCKVKALYAVSCIVREYDPAEHLFMELEGFSFLMRAIQTKNSKLIMKSVFLLNYFIEKSDSYKDTLLSMGFIEQFVIVLFNDQIEDACREYCIRSLLSLCSTYKSALAECLRPEFRLTDLLRERKQAILGKEEHRDEDEYIDSFLKLTENGDDSDEEKIR